MPVYIPCESCGTELSSYTNAQTRVEFAMQDGETKKINCKNCGTTKEYQVDELYAKPSKIAQLIAGLILFIGTPLLFFGINPIFTGNRNHYVIYIISGFLIAPGLPMP
jgi:DNA-directed RNA polymerase subunit M/transcription elongation factor TFIIS